LTTAIAGGTRSQVAKAEAEGFLIVLLWRDRLRRDLGGIIAYIGLATAG